MDEQPRHGHASSRTGTCHRPGSSEEEQVPFKHWVRISKFRRGTMLGKSPSISASIYYRIGCGKFFFRPRAKQGKENTQCDGPGKGL